MPFPNPSTQFKPGQSGNPGGRPAGRSITARLRDLLETKTPQGAAMADVLAEVILRGALQGDTRLITEILDRTEGKPRQAVEVSGPAGGPVPVSIEAAIAKLYPPRTEGDAP